MKVENSQHKNLFSQRWDVIRITEPGKRASHVIEPSERLPNPKYFEFMHG